MKKKFVEELTEKLVKKLPGVPREEIEKRLQVLITEFKVPPSEAIRSIVNYAYREYRIEAPTVKVAELQPGTSATVKVKVVRLFQTRNGKVKQVGLAGDETGLVRFAIFKDVTVEEGKIYEFKNVSVEEFNNRITITVTALSEVSQIDGDIEVKARDEAEFEGAVVAVQKNSGLVQRCKHCGRVVGKGVCPVHGKTEVEEVLRAKIIVDDGETVIQAVLSGELVTKLTGLTFDKAMRIKAEHGRESTYDYLVERLVGRYIKLKGGRGVYLIASEAEVIA